MSDRKYPDLPQWPIDYCIRTNPPAHRPRRYVTIPLTIVSQGGTELVEMEHDIPSGTPVYVDGSGVLQVASPTNWITSRAVGLTETGNRLRIGGVFEFETSRLTPGAFYFLGDGEVTTDPPTEQGQVITVIGTSISPTKLIILPREVVRL